MQFSIFVEGEMTWSGVVRIIVWGTDRLSQRDYDSLDLRFRDYVLVDRESRLVTLFELVKSVLPTGSDGNTSSIDYKHHCCPRSPEDDA
jgi:hypothetical protein